MNRNKMVLGRREREIIILQEEELVINGSIAVA